MNKDAAKWFVRYKLLDLRIKGLNNVWKVSSIPWRVVSKIDNKRIKGLSWDDKRAMPMINRALHACDKEMARTRRLIPMARRRSDYYLNYLREK